jgi:rhamnulokinase
MDTGHTFLAIDLGAETGRAMAARLRGGRLLIEPVHRFANTPTSGDGRLSWDVGLLQREIRSAISRASAQAAGQLSIGVDSWAVDFGLVDEAGSLTGEVVHYRDRRTTGMIEQVGQLAPPDWLYQRTGIQTMPINTLFQLMSLRGSPALDQASRLLLVPDLVNYWLTGVQSNEETVASTTQLLDGAGGSWAYDLLDRLGLPRHVFRDIRPAGTVLGPLDAEWASIQGGTDIPVVAVASHDTASAVVAVPMERPERSAYISSGTWSLVGMELETPVLTEDARKANFSNERGFAGTIRFLKNVMGLWLLQECGRTWVGQGEDVTPAGLIHAAATATPFLSVIDPDDPMFLPPGAMPERVASYCRSSGQPIPDTVGGIVRTILESLAAKYALVIRQLASVTGRTVDLVHVVGGGSRNELLCQMTADATGLPVLAGPAEATAMGNALVQAYALGRLGSLDELRAVSRRSSEVRQFLPQAAAAPRWAATIQQLEILVAQPIESGEAEVEPSRV